jgi:hypothetical protein
MLIEVDGDREVRRIVTCAVALHLGTGGDGDARAAAARDRGDIPEVEETLRRDA